MKTGIYKFIQPTRNQSRGFALIATISISALLMMVAIATLSLSSVTTRESSQSSAQDQAKANAKLALMLAIAQLQESAGSDQRITADASILDASVVSPHALGVWESWSPHFSRNTKSNITVNYDEQKQNRFIRWLVSGDDNTLSDINWASSSPSTNQIDLFSQDLDGFSLEGQLISTDPDNSTGGFAWAISQENTKAKLNVAGPELADRQQNDDIQVQPRPNPEQSGSFTQPEDEWNMRASKLIDFRQVALDDALKASKDYASEVGAHFTTSSFGLLTNAVDGGLKVDMSLGFEMSDDDFNKDKWDVDEEEEEDIINPFRSSAVTQFTTRPKYGTQRPLYQPLVDDGAFSHERSWNGRRWDDQVHSYFPVTSVPTFDTLRSFYRIPHHLYTSNGEITVYEREGDHIAAEEGTITDNYDPPPHKHARGLKTQMAIRPVLDRVIFLFSLSLSNNKTPQYTITPVISLWNPYNTALDVEGAVAYPWLDLPIQATTRGTYNNKANNFNMNNKWISHDLKYTNAARQIPGYIYAAMTSTGAAITSSTPPIHFEPGEVRLFVPTDPIAQAHHSRDSDHDKIINRTIFMKPVVTNDDWVITGGYNIEPDDTRFAGFKMSGDDEIEYFKLEINTGDPKYPICLGLSDATTARDSNREERGVAIADILSSTFASNALSNNENRKGEIEFIGYDELLESPVPVFSMEVYHRVSQSSDLAEHSDIMYTGNPRQSSMNPFIANTGFQTGPQYKVRLREVHDRNTLLEVATGGTNVNASYGPSQVKSGGGQTHLSFFEIPREPLLSIAALQHADLSSTPFSPANQFGNSWASPYIPRDKINEAFAGNEGLLVDHSYLLNEALWDGWFFSGIAPELSPSTTDNSSSTIWDNTTATIDRSLENVIKDFATDPSVNPLRNSRMSLITGLAPEEFATAMILPEACTQIAGHLMVDGAFNINSTSVEAWTAMLMGLKGSSLDVEGSPLSVTDTPFPRFRDPVGEENNNWHGFRSLSDSQIDELATNIVSQVRERGPFLSLGEFINRRISDDAFGLSGVLQSAIDATDINAGALQGSKITTSKYKYAQNISDSASGGDTGIGIPGYLTQADLLQSIAPIITVRSDTFTIRSYGETRNSRGTVTAKAWIEATVQRFPDFVDDTDSFDTLTSGLSLTNHNLGRKFRIVSFRYLGAEEAKKLTL